MGLPLAMASRKTMPKLSCTLGKQKMWQRLYSRARSAGDRFPNQVTIPSRWLLRQIDFKRAAFCARCAARIERKPKG